MRALFTLMASTLTASFLSSAVPAFAQIDLAWDDCGAAGSRDKAFACNTNVGLHLLVPSFVAPAGVTQFIGATTEVIVYSQTSSLPPYWQASPTGCRSGLVTSEDPAVIDLQGCAIPFQAGMTATMEFYENNYAGFPNRARIIADAARFNEGIPLTAGTTYQAGVIQIRNTRTTGPGACAGCCEPMLLELARISLYQSGPGGVIVLQSIPNEWVTWREFQPCSPVPAHNASWGAIKSLYR